MDINEDVWDFPNTFEIKVMGRANCNLEEAVATILEQHAGDYVPESISIKPSSKGTFVSITAKLTVENKLQLESVYTALSKNPDVKFVL